MTTTSFLQEPPALAKTALKWDSTSLASGLQRPPHACNNLPPLFQREGGIYYSSSGTIRRGGVKSISKSVLDSSMLPARSLENKFNLQEEVDNASGPPPV